MSWKTPIRWPREPAHMTRSAGDAARVGCAPLMPAGRTGRIGADRRTGICNLRLHNCLRHRRTADIARHGDED